MNRPELLAPAGDMECLDTALRFGADAVYIGGPKLQLRADKVGFTLDGVAEAASKLHAAGKKLYVTVNAFATNKEAAEAGRYAGLLYEAGTDAVIVSDLGVIASVREVVPDLPVHVSTQANCTNAAAAMVYRSMGCKRIVLAREMDLEHIKELRTVVPEDLELEAFVHGAMCMSYSGRCMLSAYLTGRSANRGDCTQSCRWRYHLVEQTRPGEFMPVEEDDSGTTILSSYDMNALPFLDKLTAAGISSFKVEGRMKAAYYVATVVNAYRRAIDGTAPKEVLLKELDCASHRPYSSGFYFNELRKHKPDDGVYLQDCLFVGVVRAVSGETAEIEVRNKISCGDELEILSPYSIGDTLNISAITNADGITVDKASVAGTVITAKYEGKLHSGDMLRLRKPMQNKMH